MPSRTTVVACGKSTTHCRRWFSFFFPIPSTTTFTYALTATNVTSAADTGTVTFTNNYRAIIAGREALAEAQAADISTVIGPEIDALRRFRTIGWYYFGGFARLREAALYRIESAATNG